MTGWNQDRPEDHLRRNTNVEANAWVCPDCEAMLADAVDGTLTATEQMQFDCHLETSAECRQRLKDAKRGAAWLELLQSAQPEPSSKLVTQILQRTTEAPQPFPVEVSTPAKAAATVLPFRRSRALPLRPFMYVLQQPRLAMTAAMAFFSIGLTLNLAGIQLQQFHASNLSPAGVRRSFYQANAHVVRYVDNLSAIYEVESRVNDLEQEIVDDAPNQRTNSPSDFLKKKTPPPNPGISHQRVHHPFHSDAAGLPNDPLLSSLTPNISQEFIPAGKILLQKELL